MTLWNFLVINRGVFRTLPNIYDGAFLSENLTAYFRKKAVLWMIGWVVNASTIQLPKV